MIHILQLSFIIFAVWYTMQDGEIFGVLGNLFSRLPVVFHNPLYDCPVCMTPWYGTPITIFIFHVYDPLQIILIVIPAMGLNAIILKLAPDKDSPGYYSELGDIVPPLKAIAEHMKVQSHVAWQNRNDKYPCEGRTPIQEIHDNIDKGHEKIMNKKKDARKPDNDKRTGSKS